MEIAKRLSEGQNIVVIFPDTGRGYLSKVFNDVHAMIGSIQERNLLERVFRDPGVLDARVESVMDPPFPLVDVAEPVERVVPALLANNSAVLVEEGGQPVGLITRSDLLEFVAHGRAG